MNNMFALLGDSDDEKEVKSAAKPVAKKGDKKDAAAPAGAKPAGNAAKPATAPAAAPAAKDNGKAKTDNKKPDGEKKGEGRGPRPPRADGERGPRPDRTDRPRSRPERAEGAEGETPKPGSENRPRGDRPHDRHRGPREHADPDAPAPRKREFDRHPASGRGGGQRRGGRGPHSFGNEKQEAQNVEKGVTEGAEGEAAPETAEGEANVEGAAPAEAAAPEPALPPQKTFEDLQKEREQARKNSELFASSKVREVTHDFGKMKAHEAEDVSYVGGVANAAKKVVKKDRKVKELLKDVGFTVASNNAPGDGDRDYRPGDRADRGDRGERRGGRGEGRGEGRGGRGEGRGEGRGGRGEGRGGRGAPAAGGRGREHGGKGPSLADEAAFPSL